ncbi:MAG TPA: hypothetical protein VLF21_02460 [Candidatus Saccharimonadales bacterium]|nr:hypothetical protein [Candidatus Saccharimonadales bacterium]
MNLKFEVKPEQFLVLARYAGLITTVIAVGLIGYTTYQISQIAGAQPDQAYIKDQTDKLSAIKLKISAKTIKQLSELQSAGDTNIQINPGKADPFSL